MTKINALYSVVVMVAFVLLSCTNNSITEQQTVDYLQELNIGNYWVYHFNTTDDTLRYTVVEKIDINVDGINRSVSRIDMMNLHYYRFNDDVGFHYIQNNTSINGEDSLANYSVLQYKYPVEINETWIQDFNNDGYSNDDNMVECISTNIMIDCQAGNFECIAYKVTCPELTDNYFIDYYCIDVGLVKSISYNHEDNSYQEKSLVQYYVQE